MLEADLDPNTGTVQGVKIEKACSSDNIVGKATTLENSVDSPKSTVRNHDERVPTPTPPAQPDVLCTRSNIFCTSHAMPLLSYACPLLRCQASKLASWATCDSSREQSTHEQTCHFTALAARRTNMLN
jgi:hypothetical protein